MTELPVRAVYFDAVGTLIHPEPAAARVYAEAGRRHGSRLELAEIGHRFHEAFLRQENVDRLAGWRTGASRELDRWRTIVYEVLHDALDKEACFRELYEHFARPTSWQVAEDSCRLVGALTERGYLVGLASNFDERLRHVIAGKPYLGHFTNVVISSEVGWRKPSPHFFDAVCRQVGLSPEQILFVGDDRDNDYLGALAHGCRAVLLHPARPDEGTIQRILALGELPGLIDQS
jgi:putative hydrolase of the HAD superfamily